MRHRPQAILLAAALVMAAGRPAARAEDTELISAQVQSAVDRGLEWLSHNQEHDGAWSAGGGRGTNGAAVTGLTVLAFMARGHVPGQGPYGDALNRGIDYILANQNRDGILAEARLTQPMYDHGICTIALCEAYGMLDDRRQAAARVVIARAVRAILDAQHVRKSSTFAGGWRYTPQAQDSDMSVSGWQFMALRGARNAGALIPQTALDEGIAYLEGQAANDGGFYYAAHGGRCTMAMTGTGVLTLTLMGKGDTKVVRSAAGYLLSHDFAHEQDLFYAYYYCSQAAYQLGGVYWESLSRTINADLLSKQTASGAWHPPAGLGAQGGDAYATSMAILALAVPYRYLPIYQK